MVVMAKIDKKKASKYLVMGGGDWMYTRNIYILSDKYSELKWNENKFADFNNENINKQILYIYIYIYILSW